MSGILLLGSDGMLGGALRRVLGAKHRVTALTRADFDIETGGWRTLPVKGHDYVLNAAGMINKRSAAADKFFTVNAVFPHALAALCAEEGARLIHFSTDCVFAGTAAPYFEDAPTDAEDLYGHTKALGEPLTGMTIRTSIIGPEGRNGYNLMCWALARREINGFTNIYWNGLTTVALAQAVGVIIQRDLYVSGVRHLHATDCSKFQLVGLICAAFGSDARIVPAASAETRDMRLHTRHADLLAALAIPAISAQIAALVPLCDSRGYWRD
jgi:dTDP-4-dehydrorhamnose reductase